MENNVYNIDPELWAVIYRAMMLRYTDRYQSTEEFRRALSDIRIRRQNIRIPSRIIRKKSNDNESPLRQLLSKLFRS